MPTTEKKKSKKVLVSGAIAPDTIAKAIAAHQSKTQIGAHQIFLGQIRADTINGKQVKAVEYSAHESMAEKEFHRIRESAFAQFDLTCMHLYHSLGQVAVGEICMFIFVSSAHRQACFRAIEYLVEEIKAHVPIFGKEILADDSFVWKENT
jgi:molybdopterin synthase catalytic subunit